jgi:diadenosine tetraphosphate (Ap4A) HIT family hydrolase
MTMHITPEEYNRIGRSDCFVCRIIEGKPLVADPHIVYEDEQVIAFLNQFPPQEGYTIVCPKKHVERLEQDLSEEEWLHLQKVVHQVARAVSETTNAMRMYIASLGSPERNAHLHIHVCPCPPNTSFESQQFEAMQIKDGKYLLLSKERLEELSSQIRNRLASENAADIHKRVVQNR